MIKRGEDIIADLWGKVEKLQRDLQAVIRKTSRPDSQTAIKSNAQRVGICGDKYYIDPDGFASLSTVKLSGGSPANGKVLQCSDSLGNAVWATGGTGDGNKAIGFSVFDSNEDVFVCDGASFWTVPSNFNGMTISNVSAGVIIKGVTGTTTIQIRIKRDNVDINVLSGLLTIGDAYSSETFTINSLNAGIETGDKIFVDVKSIHTDTSPKGLGVTVVFS